MKVYLIGGKARSGKDTMAGFMKEYYSSIGKKACIMQISNYIKHLVKDYFGWDGKDETKPRSLFQEIGTGIIREKMNKPYFFTTRLLEDIEVLENYFDIVIVSDVRLPLEFDEIKKVYKDAVKIVVERKDFTNELSEKEKKHVTEIALDHYQLYDYKIMNTELEKLKIDAINVIKKEEQNEKNDK